MIIRTRLVHTNRNSNDFFVLQTSVQGSGHTPDEWFFWFFTNYCSTRGYDITVICKDICEIFGNIGAVGTRVIGTVVTSSYHWYHAWSFIFSCRSKCPASTRMLHIITIVYWFFISLTKRLYQCFTEIIYNITSYNISHICWITGLN